MRVGTGAARGRLAPDTAGYDRSRAARAVSRAFAARVERAASAARSVPGVTNL
jgi:hypothetical protein